MIQRFLTYFHIHDKIRYTGNLYRDFITQLGGRQFGDGLFTSFRAEELPKWTAYVEEAFPRYQGRFLLFMYDWTGCCFALEAKGNRILLFDAESEDVCAVPVSLADFLNREIPLHANVWSAEYARWRKVSGKTLAPGQCAAHRIPLFLGGEDTYSNMEITDMAVLWGLFPQMLSAIKEHEDGMVFGNFKIK